MTLGDTKAVGSVFQKVGELTLQEAEEVKALLDSVVPNYLSWAKAIVKLFL